jgi:hypothetical protein
MRGALPLFASFVINRSYKLSESRRVLSVALPEAGDEFKKIFDSKSDVVRLSTERIMTHSLVAWSQCRSQKAERQARHHSPRFNYQGSENIGAEKGKCSAPQSELSIAKVEIVEMQALQCFMQSEPILYRCAQCTPSIESDHLVLESGPVFSQSRKDWCPVYLCIREVVHANAASPLQRRVLDGRAPLWRANKRFFIRQRNRLHYGFAESTRHWPASRTFASSNLHSLTCFGTPHLLMRHVAAQQRG